MRHHYNALILATFVTWSGVLCSTAWGTTEGQETPLALPVAEQTQPTTAIQGEVWEEDDHEVLIRNERGTKSDGESRTYVERLPGICLLIVLWPGCTITLGASRSKRFVMPIWQESVD